MAPHIGPLLVTVDLASALVDRGDPIHLDGLLMEAVCRRMGRGSVSRMDDITGRQDPQIPVLCPTALGVSCALTSAAEVVAPAAPAMVYQVKRRDLEDWDRLDGPVNVAAGPMRDRLERTSSTAAAGLRWYAWGNRGEVVDMLRMLWGPPSRPFGFVGSKRRAGAGEIIGWRVEEGSHPPERCILRDGLAARHLPAAWVVSAARWRQGAWTSPYWHPQRQERVPWVGVQVDLRPEVHAVLTSITC